MESMSMRIEVVTPDVAAEYLQSNTRNRAIKPSYLDSLVRAMREGKWVLNGQPVIFDEEGVLIDGQHRLSACVKSGASFITYVVRGVADSRAFTTIDIGKVRGAHDMASYMGSLTANQSKDCVAAARIIRAYELTLDKSEFLGFTKGTDRTNERHEVMAAYALSKLPMLLECVEHIGNRFSSIAPRSILTACAYLFATKSKDQSFEFFEMLHDGVFSSPYHPIKLLRDTMMTRDRSARKTAREQNAEIMALVFKAWAAYRKGKEVRLLRWNREGVNRERFPELV